MLYEAIIGNAGSGKTTNLIRRAALFAATAPVIFLCDEMTEDAVFERMNEMMEVDTPTKPIGVYTVHMGVPFNAKQGIKAQLETALSENPDAELICMDIAGLHVGGPMLTEILHMIGGKRLVITQMVHNLKINASLHR